ncbi:hypothetical protein AAG570_000556 [Ranatra chinensis]|uniref:Uncharacterized protein n=1 Tax=Ranatra chinensis TaxID=642074 RepID=A0ABD0YXD4_9HEMI
MTVTLAIVRRLNGLRGAHCARGVTLVIPSYTNIGGRPGAEITASATTPWTPHENAWQSFIQLFRCHLQDSNLSAVMVAMYSFCFYFSVRLGSIIVGAVSMLQSLAVFIWIVLLSSLTPKDISSQINSFKQGSNFLFITRYLDAMSHFAQAEDGVQALKHEAGDDDPKAFVWLTIGLAGVHICSCCLLIIGAYKCIHRLLLPYLLVEMPRLFFLTFAHVTAMMIVKENVPDLGLLIGLTLFGSFFLIYMFYTWFCVLSLRGILVQNLAGESERNPFVVRPLQNQGASKPSMALYPSSQFAAPSYGYSNLARPTY